jgi:hypothetical protein
MLSNGLLALETVTKYYELVNGADLVRAQKALEGAQQEAVMEASQAQVHDFALLRKVQLCLEFVEIDQEPPVEIKRPPPNTSPAALPTQLKQCPGVLQDPHGDIGPVVL